VNNATIIGGTTVNVASTAGLAPGQTISGPGIIPGTTVQTVSATSFTLSQPATMGLA